MKKALKYLAPVIFAIGSLISNAQATTGRLDITNYLGSGNTSETHKTLHWLGALEGKDSVDQVNTHIFGPGINAEIYSVIPGYNLSGDARPEESLTPVNLELSLVSESNNPITVSNLENKLKVDIVPNFGTKKITPLDNFGNKPITLWEKDDADSNVFYFLANIRDANEHDQDIYIGTLNGTYNSGEVYGRYQVRFNTFSGDFDENGTVQMQDEAILARDWRNHESSSPLYYTRVNISGPNGVPDYTPEGFAIVDQYDLQSFSEDWLKDINDPNTWSKLTPKVNGTFALESRYLAGYQKESAEKFYRRDDKKAA